MDKAVTYLTNNHRHMRYDKALEKGWPIATGMIEGACRFVIEDRFGITRRQVAPRRRRDHPQARAVVVDGDLRLRENLKKRYAANTTSALRPATIEDLNLAA